VAAWTSAREDDQTAIVVRYTGLPRL